MSETFGVFDRNCMKLSTHSTLDEATARCQELALNYLNAIDCIGAYMRTDMLVTDVETETVVHDRDLSALDWWVADLVST